MYFWVVPISVRVTTKIITFSVGDSDLFSFTFRCHAEPEIIARYIYRINRLAWFCPPTNEIDHTPLQHCNILQAPGFSKEEAGVAWPILALADQQKAFQDWWDSWDFWFASENSFYHEWIYDDLWFLSSLKLKGFSSHSRFIGLVYRFIGLRSLGELHEPRLRRDT